MSVWLMNLFHRHPPGTMPLSEERSYSYEEYHSLKTQLNSQDHELVTLSYENEHLKDQIKQLKKGRLADSESISRQGELLREEHENFKQKANLLHQELKQLSSRLNTLQREQFLTDEQIVDQLRRLQQNSENWIKSHFRDVEKLASLTDPGGGFPHGSLQRRAWIQAHLTDVIYREIFAPLVFGIQDDPWGFFIDEIEASVKHTCSEAVLRNWRVGTSTAIAHMAKDNKEEVFTHIVNIIEDQYGIFSSTEEESRKQQLRELLQRCSEFKTTLYRQQHTFHFYYCPSRMEFSSNCMTFGGGEGESGKKVRFCLWPGILKKEQKGLLENALVWTMN